jgi:antitoxin PrlF
MTRMSPNGRVVIPKAIRRAANIQPKEVLTISVDESGIHLQTMRQAIKQAQASIRQYVSAERRLSDELIADRREEFQREAEGG